MGDGDDGEGDADDGEETCADVVTVHVLACSQARIFRKGSIRCLVDVNTSNLHRTEDTAHDERSRHEILLLANFEIRTSGTGEQDGRRDDTGQHGEGVLEAEEDSEDERHLVIETEEGPGGRGAIATPEEGDVGAEEGGVVVGADEAVAGGDRVDEAAVEGLLGGRAREDGVFIHRLGWESEE